jgi:hypothetical protein
VQVSGEETAQEAQAGEQQRDEARMNGAKQEVHEAKDVQEEQPKAHKTQEPD